MVNRSWLESRVISTKASFDDGEVGADLEKRIKDLEGMVAQINASPTPKTSSTATIAGLQDASSAGVSMEWLTISLQSASIEYTQVYRKCKDAFNGRLFVKFSSLEAREFAIAKFNVSEMKFSSNVDKQSFLNPDLPLDIRTNI